MSKTRVHGICSNRIRVPPPQNGTKRVRVLLFGWSKFRERGFWTSPPVGGFPAFNLAKSRKLAPTWCSYPLRHNPTGEVMNQSFSRSLLALSRSLSESLSLALSRALSLELCMYRFRMMCGTGGRLCVRPVTVPPYMCTCMCICMCM